MFDCKHFLNISLNSHCQGLAQLIKHIDQRSPKKEKNVMLREMSIFFLTEINCVFKEWLTTESMKCDWISGPTRSQDPSWQADNSERLSMTTPQRPLDRLRAPYGRLHTGREDDCLYGWTTCFANLLREWLYLRTIMKGCSPTNTLLRQMILIKMVVVIKENPSI